MGDRWDMLGVWAIPISIRYICMQYTFIQEIPWYSVRPSSTTIRISKSTLEMLEDLKRRKKARNYDELIRKLIQEIREKELYDHFGIDRGRISSFREEDRGDARV